MNTVIKAYVNSVAGYVVSDSEAHEFVKGLEEYASQISGEIQCSDFRKELPTRKENGISDII
jgi:hypothetical protein